MRTPRTLLEAVRYFKDPDVCLQFMAFIRWPDSVVRCPICGSENVHFLANQRRWKCSQKHERRQFSVKVGTIFEDSPLGLDKWLPAVWQVVNCKNGISSYEMARALGVTQKTAWFMDHRIRKAMQAGSFEKMKGEVEADETFIGGLARFMHKTDRARKIKGTGSSGKAIVMGLLDRETGKVHVKHVPNAQRDTLHSEVRKHASMLRLERKSLPANGRVIMGSIQTTCTTLSITLKHTLKATSTRTGSRISGVS